MEQKIEVFNDTLKQILARMSAMECQSHGPIASSKSRSDYDDCRDFRMKINLPNLNAHLKIEEFLDWISKRSRFDTKYDEEFYRLSSRVDLIESESCMISRFKVALQSFFKLNDIIMASKHAEALLERKNQN
ncbi:unnamed protein product [Spirodela intermedia]|uniref:Uncharacterized protein n=1 Tax=Spirodela intermedia TaxID=51605 RepID=A0A7I8J2H1_SPIIN|nr:unnamed protein product [Spirodela intermedia]CAA6664259.1 unnamed protein product [Spirodela intermedia]